MAAPMLVIKPPLEIHYLIARQATERATKELLVKVALREHAKIMTSDPRPSSFDRIVDGVSGVSEENVKPHGIIIYRYKRLEGLTKKVMEKLFDLSPVLSGDYRNNHTMMVNGEVVRNLKDWDGSPITIFNPLPYARKIELGRMHMRVSGTSRVYQQAAQALTASYGRVMKTRFTFIQWSGRRVPALIISSRGV